MLKFSILLAAVAVCYGDESTKFYLSTKDDGGVPQVFNTAASPVVLPTNFKPDHPIIILVHGHGGNRISPFNTEITSRMFRFVGEYNVIVVDWEKAASYSYSVASGRVRVVGPELKDFIIWLLTNTPATVTASTLHLVGFGLGAHVVGIAGREVRASTLQTIGRITGLDPSGSGWGSNSLRLGSTDATYVEVIHTDGSGLFANGIGTAIGNVNFYANGGSNQPGCFSNICSHNRAWELFAASFENENLVGYPCKTTTQLNLNLCRGHSLHMGGTAMFKERDSNVYRINTRRSYPF